MLIPYADAISFPSTRIRVRRDFSKLLALIKVSAYLHQHQRPKIMLEGGEHIIAAFADYHLAYRLAEKVMRPTILGLPEGVLRVYDACRRLADASEEITSATATEHSEYSQSTVRHYLNRLVKARLLVKGEGGKEHIYRLIEQEAVAFNGNAALKERFGEKEFRDWLAQCCITGIGYEDLHGEMYDPLAEYHIAAEANKAADEAKEAKDMALPHNTAFNRRKAVDDVLQTLEQKHGEIPVLELVLQLMARGIEDAEGVVRRMMADGELFEPRKGFVKRGGFA